MKIRILLLIVCFSVLCACGGGSADDPIDTAPATVTEVTVGADGTLSYAGSGEFEGFSINASVPELAGKTLYIEKNESESSYNGYVSLSALYSVRLTQEERGLPETLYDAAVTIPYSADLFENAGVSAESLTVCALLNDAPVPYDSNQADGAVSASANIPLKLIAGFIRDIELPGAPDIIVLQGRSYADSAEASQYLTDINGTKLPDVVRGINHVQPGETVRFTINEEAFGDIVSNSSWTLDEKPDDSGSILEIDGHAGSFIPDRVGRYGLTLSAEGQNGKSVSQSVKIFAANYSYSKTESNAFCLAPCHSSDIASTRYIDQYGRQKLRNITDSWRSSAHASAFDTIETETDTSCLQCHVTGYFFADRNSDGFDDHPGTKGFDDTISDWSDPVASGTEYLRGVSCEACHGPAEGINSTFYLVHYSKTPIGSDVCLTCHGYGSMDEHYFDYSDKHDNSHKISGAVIQNSECFKCHTGEGIMGQIYGKEFFVYNTESVSGIGCPVCHDPHGEGGNDAQLRIKGSFVMQLKNGTSYSADAGNSLLCYKCHNSDSVLPMPGTIPHNTQAEMIHGIGGYTYGQELAPQASSHAGEGLHCSDCHMHKDEGVTHRMLMSDEAEKRIASCSDGSCHASDSPVYENGHYDIAGIMSTVRQKLDQLKSAINAKAGIAEGSAVSVSYSVSNEALTEALNNAAYNYNYILSDKSSGFHNPGYAEQLIELSLNDLASY